MQLDMTTTVSLEIGAATLVAAFLPVARDARTVPGFREAGYGAACQAAAFSVHLLRLRGASFAPTALFGIAFNALLLFAAALQWCAYRRFRDSSAPLAPILAIAGACTAFFSGLWIFHVGYTGRTVTTSLMVAAIAAAGSIELARERTWVERSRAICIGVGVLVSACLVLRVGVLLLSHDVDDDPSRPSLHRTIAFFPSVLFTLGGGLGFVIMHRERSDARSRELALTDALTGCLNRRALEERVRGELDYAVRTAKSLALIVVDLDHFKRINDTHGHAVGDEAIRHVAKLLQHEARTSDVVARYGGEEFCLLVRDSSADGAATLASRIRGTLRATPMPLPAGEPLAVTASFGVAAFDPASREGWESLFKRADAALYRAKEAGRDRIEGG